MPVLVLLVQDTYAGACRRCTAIDRLAAEGGRVQAEAHRIRRRGRLAKQELCPTYLGQLLKSVCIHIPHMASYTCSQVHVEDAELLTDWQRKQAEFKQRRAISGAEGAKAKQERMKQFQQRLRGAAAAEEPAVKPDAEPTPEVSLYTR